jgi:hypothetical protein
MLLDCSCLTPICPSSPIENTTTFMESYLFPPVMNNFFSSLLIQHSVHTPFRTLNAFHYVLCFICGLYSLLYFEHLEGRSHICFYCSNHGYLTNGFLTSIEGT